MSDELEQTRDRTHSDECWRWHEECAEALIEAQQARLGKLSMQLMWYPDWRRGLVKAEAAIKRVREVCANPETTWRPGEGLGLVRVESILRALEGDDR